MYWIQLRWLDLTANGWLEWRLSKAWHAAKIPHTDSIGTAQRAAFTLSMIFILTVHTLPQIEVDLERDSVSLLAPMRHTVNITERVSSSNNVQQND